MPSRIIKQKESDNKLIIVCANKRASETVGESYAKQVVNL